MDLPDLKLYANCAKNGHKKAIKMGLGVKIFCSITEVDGKSRRSITIFKCKQKGVKMFTEYKSTRAKKAPEDLASAKDWQVNARRLYLPLDAKKYGLSVQKWEEDGKKRHKITWKQKPYAKLMLNQDKKAKAFAMLEVNTSAGIAIQVDPANYKRVYISIPAGAMGVFPKVNAMLDYKQEGAKITLSAK